MILRRALLPAGVAVLVALVVGGWLLVRPVFDPASVRLLRYDVAAAGDPGLTVYAERTCGDRLGRTVVLEDADRVEVTVRRASSDADAVCAAVHREWEVAVELDEPLAGRPVYDGGCLAAGRSDTACRLPASSR